jgi:hypothetical protein
MAHSELCTSERIGLLSCCNSRFLGDVMHRFARLIGVAAIVAAAASASAAYAQDGASMTLNGTTITLGGGGQFLTLPDIKFTGVASSGGFHRQTNSDFADYGGAGGAAIETSLGYMGGYRVTGSIKGFFSSMEDSDRKGCDVSGCVVVSPTGSPIGIGSFVTKTDRDVDYWGGSAEAKFGRAEPAQVRPNFMRYDYFLVGADVRGIDQDNSLRGRGDVISFNYKEQLDTTYYGGYVGFGGEYSFGFLGAGGLWDRLGLRSYYSGRAGLYSANTDYSGRFDPLANGVPVTHLSLSDNELAFIGSVSFETRKQFSPRTSLSLWTDYEYISSVPSMRYTDGGITSGRPTRIADEGEFATRTMLRLNIGLGPTPLYAEPLNSQSLK